MPVLKVTVELFFIVSVLKIIALTITRLSVSMVLCKPWVTATVEITNSVDAVSIFTAMIWS